MIDSNKLIEKLKELEQEHSDLDQILIQLQEKHTVDITVIESKDIGIIGVGEATVHSIRFFFAAMGLDEAELLKETNATLKAGIMFNNWMKPDPPKNLFLYRPRRNNAS